MPRIRHAGVTAVIVPLAIAFVAAFLFNSVLHSLIPHDHGHGAQAELTMHAALRVAEKAVSVIAFAAFFVTTFVVVAQRTAVPVVIETRRDRLLHKGIEKYRRFA